MKYGTVEIAFWKSRNSFFLKGHLLKLSQTHFNLGLIKFIIKTITNNNNNKVLLLLLIIMD